MQCAIVYLPDNPAGDAAIADNDWLSRDLVRVMGAPAYVRLRRRLNLINVLLGEDGTFAGFGRCLFLLPI